MNAAGKQLWQRRLSRRDGRRKAWNALMCAALGVAALVALAPLLAVFAYTLQKGVAGLDWALFTALPKPVGEAGGGLGNALLGTVCLIGIAAAIAVPWGMAVGVFLSEYGKARAATVARFAVDVLTSVPSIIVGLFAYALVVMPLKRFSMLAGGVALSFIMVPIIARSTEELLKLVPNHVREAGLALGLPRWRVITSIVVRGSLGGLSTGIMLAVARAAGETAPLLFTAFNNAYWPRSIDQPTSSLPVQIYAYAISPYEDWHRQAWAGALVLVIFVFVLNAGTRLLIGQRKAES